MPESKRKSCNVVLTFEFVSTIPVALPICQLISQSEKPTQFCHSCTRTLAVFGDKGLEMPLPHHGILS